MNYTGCIVTYIALGKPAIEVCEVSIISLRQHYHGMLNVSKNVLIGGIELSREVKTLLPHTEELNGLDYILYLDADTTVHGSLEPLFQILKDGWDMVIAPSTYQGEQAMHHIVDIERLETLDIYGFTPLQLQGGVIAFANTEIVQRFFECWHSEWQEYREQDQAALLRALHEWDIRVWIIGNAFNGGEVIQHHFGSIK